MPVPDLTDHSIPQLLDLSGRTAVVTGGAKGLGLAIGRRLVEAGATVILADIDADGVAAAAASLGAGTEGVVLDVTDAEANHALARQVVDSHGSLDIWVNNAGVYPFERTLDVTPEQWRQVMAVNLDGCFFGSQAAARHMVEKGEGVIVNLASTAGYGAEDRNFAHYVSTKHAVRGLTKALALEWGPKGVRTVAVAPTLTLTPGTEDRRAALAARSGGADIAAAFARQIPLRRVGVPDDVARVVLFCVSGLAGFVNGETVLVDGGARAR